MEELINILNLKLVDSPTLQKEIRNDESCGGREILLDLG